MAGAGVLMKSTGLFISKTATALLKSCNAKDTMTIDKPTLPRYYFGNPEPLMKCRGIR
jgi:hypothetical protein